ncbi:F-box protein At5g03970 [Lolium perenne]|uniref:F-box protein At5g03970 n=1 Tax=Lolium perenne TaxID=4522 RepID=UPI0021F58600|nr:uncharacterized protein LOC127334031 [Lolium perenne]
MTPPPPPQPGQDSLPALVDDLVSDILLRLPPDEPECLFRASLVCKTWNRLLSDRAFRRRYCEFHRAPPVLGFLHNRSGLAPFVPTTAFRPPDTEHCYAIGCHHGRALLRERRSPDFLTLWDPVTNEKQYVRMPDIPMASANGLVLCATPGCDHLDCHGGPFLVAFVGFDAGGEGASACLYTSETGAWSTPSYLQLDSYLNPQPPVVVGDALYLVCEDGETIMRDKFAGKRGLSLIEPPDVYEEGVVLMTVEDGGLGIAGLDMSTLYLWSLKTDPGGVSGWKTRGVIKLEMLPIDDLRSWRHLVGFAKGCTSDIVFVTTDAGVFKIDLKSEEATKVCEHGSSLVIFPYTSFCTPGRANCRLPSPAAT